jgi:hypothetical protein
MPVVRGEPDEAGAADVDVELQLMLRQPQLLGRWGWRCTASAALWLALRGRCALAGGGTIFRALVARLRGAAAADLLPCSAGTCSCRSAQSVCYRRHSLCLLEVTLRMRARLRTPDGLESITREQIRHATTGAMALMRE